MAFVAHVADAIIDDEIGAPSAACAAGMVTPDVLRNEAPGQLWVLIKVMTLLLIIPLNRFP